MNVDERADDWGIRHASPYQVVLDEEVRQSAGVTLPHRVALVGGAVALPTGIVQGDVLLQDGLVQSIGEFNEGDLLDCVVIDCVDQLVAPGFVDLQCNGALGIDITTDPAAMWTLAELLPRWGVTSFLPTLISSPLDRIQLAQRTVLRPPVDHRGARILGLHLEGPFLNPARAGAHPATFLRDPVTFVNLDWSPDTGVVLVTLAPELKGAHEIITTLKTRRVVVAAGHTNATSADMTRAYDLGVTMVTHLFNAMSPLTHREPNVVGFALGHDALHVGMIADGVHVAPSVVRLAYQLLGPHRCVLVSDAVAALGLTPQRLSLGTVELVVEPDRVTTTEGVLAGSVLSMDQAVRNLRTFTGCDSFEAITCATRTPALALGRDDLGVIRKGAPADLVILDADLRVTRTLVAGVTVFSLMSGS